jgi:hypothetical protein
MEDSMNIILPSILFLIILVVSAAYFTQIQAKKLVGNMFSKVAHCYLLLNFSWLILYTVFNGYVAMIERLYSTDVRISNTIAKSILPLQIMLPGLNVFDKVEVILPYCPAIIDIYDGIEMSETQLNLKNPVWLQIIICLAVIMFYIPSLLEIYHLRYPQLKNGSSLSERRIRLSQFVSSCMFVVLRVVLFAYNPHEIGLVIKTLIRVYCHYNIWSNLNRAPKIVSKQPTEISAETALTIASKGLSLYDTENDKTYRCNEIRIDITSDINTSINYNRCRSLSV